MSLVHTLNVAKQLPFQRRTLWHWINIIFNSVDEQRRKVVGPDRSCAEWILRNGGAVKWEKEHDFLRDYNQLPDDNTNLRIVEIDATESSIMHYGFGHLQDCKYIRKIILHKCTYLEDPALKELSYVKESLTDLQITSCPNITDKGLLDLKYLKKLKTLKLADLPFVKDKYYLLKVMNGAVPACRVGFD